MPAVEPSILLLGRRQEVLDVLVEELHRGGRRVVASTPLPQEELATLLDHAAVDLVLMGGGLPDTQRDELAARIGRLSPGLQVERIQRGPGASPAQMIPFVHEQAVRWKVARVLGSKPQK